MAELKCATAMKKGKSLYRDFFGAGELFGEPPLFDAGSYPATAVLDEDCKVIRLRKKRHSRKFQLEQFTLI